ncbi:unnamed protein product [Hymenolepis diminuta]|uniref:Transcriptional regulator n=1 Tax=Hymenolepis diminuta TaxID=6216 RepID=A0A0R3SBE3_HYMDI|nr:unnamed protein product [Hymenolepis diminuta]
MSDTTMTPSIKGHAVMVSVKAKQRSLEMARFLLIARSFLCISRKELMNEKGGDELITTERRKSTVNAMLTHSLRTPEFVRRVHGMACHGMMEENQAKSMLDNLSNIFKCLKE